MRDENARDDDLRMGDQAEEASEGDDVDNLDPNSEENDSGEDLDKDYEG